MKKFLVAAAVAVSSMAANAAPTMNGVKVKGLVIDADPRGGVIIVTNNGKSTIDVKRTIVIMEGVTKCDTNSKPVTIKPGQTVEIPEGDECGLWASTAIWLATPKGVIKQNW